MATDLRVSQVPFEEMSFADRAQEYVRRQALGRRGFLVGGASLLGVAALAGFGGRANAQTAGGHLVIGRAAGSDTLDNHKTSSISSSEVQRHIYDTLVMLDANTGTVHPGLATSWSFENDDKTVIFKLRQGVNFHDGTPFNAQAVEATVARHRAPETASPTTFLLGPLDSVEVIDDETVAYHYEQPFVGIWAALTLVYSAPHSPEAAARLGAEFGRNPVGTGPFRFRSWDANDVITLERNEGRDWATSLYVNSGPAYLESAEYRTIPEPSTRVAALLSGEVDILAGSGEAVPADSYGQLQRADGITITTQPALGITAVIPCQALGPMADVRIRQAIAHAIDKEKMLAFALNGRGTVATSAVASAMFHYDVGTVETAPQYDPERARELLAEAGVSGLELKFLGPDDSAARIIGESLQADLAAVGISLVIDSLPTAEYAALRSQNLYHLVYTNYSFSDADILRQMLSSDSPLNYSRHKNSHFDELAAQQGSEFDPEKRGAILKEMQDIVLQEAIWIPLVEREIAAAARANSHIRLSAEGVLILPDSWKD